MKVNKLIEQLKEYNQNADITLTTSEDICLSYICESVSGDSFDKRNTPIVFIEPKDFEEDMY